MNDEEKDRFLAEINTIPLWVRNFSDLRKFCRHIYFRFVFERSKKEELLEYLQKNHSYILQEVSAAPESPSSQMQDFYDKIYNSNAHLAEFFEDELLCTHLTVKK